MVGPEVDRLHVATCAQVPEVNAVAVSVAEQIFGNDAVLELRRQRPFARDHVVAGQVPPEIIVKLLRTSIDLPPPEHLETLAVHDENARRPLRAVRASPTKSADVDALRPAARAPT